MIKKKLCLLGTLGVGKTSLIKKYVQNIFSQDYLVTVGVKVDKKLVKIASGQEISLIIWDMEGQDDFTGFADSYLRGLSGYFVVADGTRRDSFASAMDIGKSMCDMFPEARSSLLLNKVDLIDEWKIEDSHFRDCDYFQGHCYKTSAKTGVLVDEAFVDIATRMVESDND